MGEGGQVIRPTETSAAGLEKKEAALASCLLHLRGREWVLALSTSFLFRLLVFILIGVVLILIIFVILIVA